MKKIYLLLVAVFVSTHFLNAQPTSQTFNSSGTYTVPTGYTASVILEAWGAGGGGGSNTSGAKGGGGGGAYVSSTTTLTAGSYTVTVGTGGGAGAAGGNSSFTTIVIAEGGGSTTTGTGGAGGTTAGSTGTTKVAGTAGANNSGNDGGAGGAGANGGGAGGTGGTGNSTNATNGTQPGGGGGGKGGPGNSTSSGNGGAGRVVVTVNTILPVRLKSFSAVKKNNGVQLQWNAEVESNFAGYTVERSYDGSQFTAVRTIASSNSAIPVSYDYLDAGVSGNVVYYRIVMNELDGKATFSRIIKVVSGAAATQLLVYPNPVRGGIVSFITPDMAKGTYNVKIFNSNAQVVYQMKYTHSGGSLSQQLQLPAGLKPGIYNLQLNDTQVKFQQSFLLQ
jgi:hypothetical protein